MSPPAARAAPRILVSLLTSKRDDIDLLRRRIGYRRLVLLAHPGSEQVAEAVRRDEDGESTRDDGVVRIAHLPFQDAHAHLAAIRKILREESERERTRAAVAPHIVLNAAGGDPALVMAMLLIAYEEGHETWFTQEGHHVRLPVLAGVRLENRLQDDEEIVLRALPELGATSTEIAQRVILARDRVERAYRGLEKKDLVQLYAAAGRVAARPTHVGAYVRGHLGAGTHR